LVVGFDPAQDLAQLASFRTKYGVLAGVQIFGPWSGKLNNGGDAVELYRPDPPQESDRVDAGYVPYIRVDKVNYRNGATWPPDADDTGKSLQRKNSTEFGNDPKNWQAATPTAGKSNSAEVADSDGDGMPDIWELQHAFNPQDPNDATADADLDGFSNLQEYIAETDPRDPASRLTLQVVSYSSTDGAALVFLTVPGKSYTIESRSSLMPSITWEKLKNIDAVASQTTFQDTNSVGKAERFYRIVTPSY
jgi:hypothetical protein